MENEEIIVEIGSHNTLIIDKLFGPLSMSKLRLNIDSKEGEYVIERQRFNNGIESWEVTARINGCTEDL